MTPSDPESTEYQIHDLVEASMKAGQRLMPRTIRSYVERGLIPGPEGRGRGATYSQECMDRLLFIARVRNEIPFHVSLDYLAELLSSLKPEQIRRVARGDEEVVAHIDDRLAELHELGMGHLHRMSAGPTHRPHKARLSSARPEAETWTTIALTDDLELRLRGHEPAKIRWLAQMARKFRALLEEESSDG